MRAKLIVEGKEFPIEIQDPELEKLLKPQKQTGYERSDKDRFWFETDCGDHFWMPTGVCDSNCDECAAHDDATCCDRQSNNDMYDAANYYSDETIAENNARADRLMRQLRRFAVEHRKREIDWAVSCVKYEIGYDHSTGDMNCLPTNNYTQFLFNPYFDSEEVALLAIETFHDELIWYFTEYKDSL